MFQHNVTGLFGCGKSFEWRADDLHREPILIKRTPRGYEAGFALKTGAAATLVTDHKRKAVTTRIPYLDVFDRENNATELHDMRDYRVAVAQTAPPAKNVTPAMKIAVSNLVISQPLRMARLNCLTAGMASE